MKRLIAALAAALTLLPSGCAKYPLYPSDGVEAKERKDIVLSKSQKEMIPSTEDFTFDFLRGLVARAPKGENVFCSPFSLQTCLSMVAAGARGETASEILGAVGFGSFSPETIGDLYKTLIPALKDVDNTTEVAIANSLWVNRTFPVLDSYSKLLQSDFLASVHPFSGNPTAPLSAWVSKETRGMIPSFPIDGEPDVMMANALYFNGAWKDPFRRELNRVDKFTCSDGTLKDVTYMRKTDYLGSYVGEKSAAVRIPYGNGAYVMTIAIPMDGYTVDDIVADLDSETWKLYFGRGGQEVDLWLPKFETDYTASDALVQTLQDLGMVKAFTPEADFSGISELSILIDKVIQKSKIQVDERGTKAASATVSIGKGTSVGPGHTLLFKVDCPFFYAISEISTGLILFAGVQNRM